MAQRILYRQEEETQFIAAKKYILNDQLNELQQLLSKNYTRSFPLEIYRDNKYFLKNRRWPSDNPFSIKLICQSTYPKLPIHPHASSAQYALNYSAHIMQGTEFSNTKYFATKQKNYGLLLLAYAIEHEKLAAIEFLLSFTQSIRTEEKIENSANWIFTQEVSYQIILTPALINQLINTQLAEHLGFARLLEIACCLPEGASDPFISSPVNQYLFNLFSQPKSEIWYPLFQLSVQEMALHHPALIEFCKKLLIYSPKDLEKFKMLLREIIYKHIDQENFCELERLLANPLCTVVLEETATKEKISKSGSQWLKIIYRKSCDDNERGLLEIRV